MIVRGILRTITVAAVMAWTVAPVFSQARRSEIRSPKAAPAEPVDLNDASESELRAVPGITSRTARRIIAGRPYSSVADLSNAGIPAATIKRISKNVSVSGKGSRLSEMKAAPGDGPGMVWVTEATKVYHEPGDKWYGKTKNGKYMKESEAIAEGYRASKEK